MSEVVSALILQKVDCERRVYGLKALEGARPGESVEALRAGLEAVELQARLLGEKLAAAKGQIEDSALSAVVDEPRRRALEQLHRDFGGLEEALQRQLAQATERLRLRMQRRSLWASLGEGDRRRLDELRGAEALAERGNAQADRIVLAGGQILESLDRQRGSARRVLAQLGLIGAELRASEWTAAAIKKRLQSDGRLVLLLALVSLVLLFLLGHLLRR